MAYQLSDEKLRSMNLERVDGIIRPIGTIVSPAVQKAEEAAENKPKHIDYLEGYPKDEPNINIHHPDIKMPMERLRDDMEAHPEDWKGYDVASVDQDFSDAMHSQVPEIEPQYPDLDNEIKFKEGESFDGAEFKYIHIDEYTQYETPARGLQPGKWSVITNGFEVEEGNFQWADEEKTKVVFVPDKKAPRRRGPSKTKEVKIDVMKQYVAGVDPAYGPEHQNTVSVVVTKNRGESDGLSMKLGPIVPFPSLVEEMKNYYPAPVLQEKKRVFGGIDNGVSGSVGLIFDDGTYSFCKTPVINQQDYTKEKKMINRINTIELYRILSVCGPGSMIMIERPMVNPGMFNATMSAVRAYEATITVLEALRLPYAVTDSKAFQKEFLPTGSKGPELKTASLSVGKRLFPGTMDVKHPDRDGMLIAALCKKLYK